MLFASINFLKDGEYYKRNPKHLTRTRKSLHGEVSLALELQPLRGAVTAVLPRAKLYLKSDAGTWFSSPLTEMSEADGWHVCDCLHALFVRSLLFP